MPFFRCPLDCRKLQHNDSLKSFLLVDFSMHIAMSLVDHSKTRRDSPKREQVGPSAPKQ